MMTTSLKIETEPFVPQLSSQPTKSAQRQRQRQQSLVKRLGISDGKEKTGESYSEKGIHSFIQHFPLPSTAVTVGYV